MDQDVKPGINHPHHRRFLQTVVWNCLLGPNLSYYQVNVHACFGIGYLSNTHNKNEPWLRSGQTPAFIQSTFHGQEAQRSAPGTSPMLKETCQPTTEGQSAPLAASNSAEQRLLKPD
ncbi:hypothetical protein Bbelb_367650 [Branchiostoma belcheri]|nr:hypothetical protein Bbelb_367650 [Branchiostoma belcheri]